MNLTQEPEIVNLPAMHYVYVEKVGSFQQNAGQAWQQAHSLVSGLLEKNKIVGHMSLYKIGPQIYRAGFALAGPPVDVPSGLLYEEFEGGKYARFILTGGYGNLPAASGEVWRRIELAHLKVREGFAVEDYKNDPRVTPEDQLITHIELPIE